MGPRPRHSSLRPFVPAEPPPQLSPAPNVTVSPGETARLSCEVLDEGPFNLTWIREWRALPAAGDRVTQLADLSLELRAVVPSDAGQYQCVASNANGVTRASIWLLVRGGALTPKAQLWQDTWAPWVSRTFQKGPRSFLTLV